MKKSCKVLSIDEFLPPSILPGMRNSHDYLNDTTWSSYNKRNCRWSSSSSFVIIHQDGTFDEEIKKNYKLK